MNSSHVDNEKGMTRQEGRVDFGNELLKVRNMSSHRRIISREDTEERQQHIEGSCNQHIFVPQPEQSFTECALPVWLFLKREQSLRNYGQHHYLATDALCITGCMVDWYMAQITFFELFFLVLREGKESPLFSLSNRFLLF